ncbi:MAG: CpsD/CapB family tyrosine-protein kinase [Oscillospiraceae bacterium]|nr:CpsD/CapB family tyrosine-protein kinase [Oscillospiraceae bacterium]
MAKKEDNKKSVHSPARRQAQQGLICESLSFAASEAYKLLRTNLLFSMPEKPCHIIGVTSSVRGEGKSTTSVNLAYTFAQSGKKVLLIDGDLRLPTVATKLNLHRAPGLSNLLAGLNSERHCLQKSAQMENWFIMSSGDIPPNPSELLGSERMHALLDRYAEVFDYIILDLPPVNIVADALVISKWLDGLVLVVRQNYITKRALNECMYQIEKLNAKLLGFVMTDAQVSESSYKKYGKYGKSYGYGYGYDYSYASASEPTDDTVTRAFINATADVQESDLSEL